MLRGNVSIRSVHTMAYSAEKQALRIHVKQQGLYATCNRTVISFTHTQNFRDSFVKLSPHGEPRFPLSHCCLYQANDMFAVVHLYRGSSRCVPSTTRQLGQYDQKIVVPFPHKLIPLDKSGV